MSLDYRIFTRSTPPDSSSLAAALAPLLPSINGSFLFDYSPITNTVTIAYSNWAGIDTAAVQTAVTNCIQETDRTDAKGFVDQIALWEKACFLVILDEINNIRAALSLAPRTVNQFFTAVKNKIDTL